MSTTERPAQTSDDRVYEPLFAPKHLMTRRQLRAAGLRPGGQQPVAWVPVEWRGRTQLAGLYDSRRAAPKRTATPAQLRAVAKAIREHQTRAAERRGIARADLATDGDPGPAWADTTTQQEENPMPDTTARTSDELQEIHDYAAHLDDMYDQALRDAPAVWTVLGEDGTTTTVTETDDAADETVTRAQERLHEHLREHRDVLGTEPTWRPYYEAIDHTDALDHDRETETAPPEPVLPAGHGQRIAYLLATAAVNQARDRRERLAADAAHAEGRGAEAVAWYRGERAKAQAVAEARLATSTQPLGPASVAPLADALVWHQDSRVAAGRLDEITAAYGGGWGVVIDPDRLAVTIDPDVDAGVVQDYTEAVALRAREAAAVDSVTAMALTDSARAQVSAAMTGWLSTDIDPAHPRAYLDSDADRRERLAADLAGLSDDDRARVDFVVDYLRADTRDVDLLATPVFVDPGVEVRGRVPLMLEAFTKGQYAGKEIAEEISVMTPEDQQRIRQAGKAIAARQPVDIRLWPGYVNRDEITDELRLYADDAEELRADADYLPQAVAENIDNPELWGISDDTAARITRLAARREELLAFAAGGEGLAAMERAQLDATLGDIDTGRIRTSKELPELLWADERSKAAADEHRAHERGAELAVATREAMTQRLTAAGVDLGARDNGMLLHTVRGIGDSVYSVAAGAAGRGMDSERRSYLDKRTALGEALARAGVDQSVRTEIRAIIDGRARQAGEIGHPVAARRDQWKAKTDYVVATRDDAAAQRQAVAASRPPDGAARTCTTQTDRSAAAAPAPGRPAGLRHLHTSEVER